MFFKKKKVKNIFQDVAQGPIDGRDDAEIALSLFSSSRSIPAKTDIDRINTSTSHPLEAAEGGNITQININRTRMTRVHPKIS